MEEYVMKQGKRLRRGFTTGSCAALAARAAAYMVLNGQVLVESCIVTPEGTALRVPILDVQIEEKRATCAVQKDAGDDPDITDGMLVYAAVEKVPGKDITIDGGEGVGRVTKKGLDQPMGAAAINSVPRRMITEAVDGVREAAGYEGGLAVTISIPGGEEAAQRTFNPQLGIVGGLSVIGTSGIVEPMSTAAIVDTIGAELSVAAAEGATAVVLTPGNYGQRFLQGQPDIALQPVVKCANFVGEALDLAAAHGFAQVLLVGHMGKLVKLAGGIMDTHSRTADGRLEQLALQAALAGAQPPFLQQILACTTTDAAAELIKGAGLLPRVVNGLLSRMDTYLARRAKGAFAVGAVMFNHADGLLGISPAGGAILEQWRGAHE